MIRASIAVSRMFMREVYLGVSRRLIYLSALFVVGGPVAVRAAADSADLRGPDHRERGPHAAVLPPDAGRARCVCATIPDSQGIRLYALAGLIGVGAGFLSEVIQKPLAPRRIVGRRGGGCGRCGLRRSRCTRCSSAALRCVAGIVRSRCVVAICLHRNIPRAPCYGWGAPMCIAMRQFPVLADFHSRNRAVSGPSSIGVNREIVDDALEVEFWRGRISRRRLSTSPCRIGGATRSW